MDDGGEGRWFAFTEFGASGRSELSLLADPVCDTSTGAGMTEKRLQEQRHYKCGVNNTAVRDASITPNAIYPSPHRSRQRATNIKSGVNAKTALINHPHNINGPSQSPYLLFSAWRMYLKPAAFTWHHNTYAANAITTAIKVVRNIRFSSCIILNTACLSAFALAPAPATSA